jgi:D-aspartate ligase
MSKKPVQSDKPYAIVVGLDCIQGLQSARILARRGVPVIGITSNGRYYSSRTNACVKVYECKTRGLPLIELLEEIGPEFEARPFLLPCQDKNVETISQYRDRLAPYYRFIMPEAGTLEMMIDKANFYRYAQANGLPLPQTFFLSGPEDVQAAAGQLQYPAIVKPPSRDGVWTKNTKLKAIVVENAEDLKSTFEKYHDRAQELIVQRLVQGGDENHVTCNIYFDSQGQPAVTFTSRKLRQWRPTTGQACLSEEVRDDKVVEETMRLFCSQNYRGFAYLEMKRDSETGEYFIIEPNIARPTGRAAMAEAAGVEFIYTAYCDAVGLPLPENRQQQYRGVKWMHLLRDIQATLYHGLRRELTPAQWWRSVRGVKTFAVLSWRDPKPFLTAAGQALFVMLSPRERT